MTNPPDRTGGSRGPTPGEGARDGARLPYLPALDGLRAMAVLAVFLYHANLPWIPGGFLGVEMFFVISGYLITSLLLAEWAQRGGISFSNFWLRRARRLFPALFTLLAVVVGYALVFLPREVATLRGDAFSTAAYVNNWYQVFSHKSYFETVGRPSLLRHMWSLAVEEQFYLCWPILFTLLMKRWRPRTVLLMVAAGILASGLAMALMYQTNSDPSRVYYGTDTRAAGLLLGVALAFLWAPGRRTGGLSSSVLDTAGLAAIGALVGCFALINEFEPFLYRGGFFLTGLFTAELVAAAVHPQARLVPRILSWEPLRWIGIRSYGVYLWHFPVFMVTRPQLDVPIDGLPLLLIRLALTLGIAALSYQFVEAPIRHGALGRAWQRWRNAQGRARRWLGWRWAAATVSLAALFSVLAVLLINAQPPPPPHYLARVPVATTGVSTPERAMPQTNSLPVATLVKPPPPPAKQKLARATLPNMRQAPTTNSSPTSVVAVVPSRVSRPSRTNRPRLSAGITAIGDSVMQGVREELEHVLGTNIVVDANRGRLPWNTPDIVRRLRAQGKIHSVVILHIGNNGFFSSQSFTQVMSLLKEARRIVVVNLKVPRRWETLNNEMLAASVKSYPNAVLADWHRAAADQPQLFWDDGIHVRRAGARVYTDLIRQAVGDLSVAGEAQNAKSKTQGESNAQSSVSGLEKAGTAAP